MSAREWRIPPSEQRFFHIMIGGEMPVRAFYDVAGEPKQRMEKLREWMASEGIGEITRTDDPLTGDIVLRAAPVTDGGTTP